MTEIAEKFDWFAEWADGVSPLYEQLARQTATDTELLDIATHAAEGQPPPNLLFGAVHALLLAGEDHRLRAFYPTCTERALDPSEEAPFPAFREFCLANEERIRELVSSRRVQTNEVGRSAVLFPAFKSIETGEKPIAIVEIGTSAGLNLYWDRFRYEYEGEETDGEFDSPVTIESTVRGDRPPLDARIPQIDRRIGIDINTLDITDPADARWLKALVIPDQQDRFERLDTAIDHLADERPTLIEGDALELLPDVLSEIPERFDVVVFSTLVLYQLRDDQITRLREILAAERQRRTVHWLSNDPSEPETPPTYRHVRFGSEQTQRQLATYKAHGEWIEWLDETNRCQ